MARRYPPEVKDFIAANVSGRTTKELVELVNARFNLDFTEGSMKSYKANNGLKSGTPCGLPKGHSSSVFPRPVLDYIYVNYQGCGNKEMAERLNAEFGTSYTTKQLNGFYKNHKLNSGLTGWFEIGHTPANKGEKGWCASGSEKTQFRKGSVPANKTPVGTVRLRSDGYLYEKYGEGCHDWKPKHQLVWERARGPVPKGHVITFRDCDKTNCNISNLTLITMAESLELTRSGLRSQNPNLTDTGILISRVKSAAHKLSKCKRRAKKYEER